MMTSSKGNIFHRRYLPFVRGIHRSLVNSPHKGQWRGTLMFSLICARINDWGNNREAGDLRRQCPHYDVNVMFRPMINVDNRNKATQSLVYAYSAWAAIQLGFCIVISTISRTSVHSRSASEMTFVPIASLSPRLMFSSTFCVLHNIEQTFFCVP